MLCVFHNHIIFQQRLDFSPTQINIADSSELGRAIQYTVAHALDGIVPGDVTDIAMLPAAARARYTRQRHLATSATSSFDLTYRVTVRDPLLSINTFRAQLVESVRSKQMDGYLQDYAVLFGVDAFTNGTFAEPKVENLGGRAVSTQLTGVKISGLVIGIVMSIALISIFVLFYLKGDRAGSNASGSQ